METLLNLLEQNARLSTDDLSAMLKKTPAEIDEMITEAVRLGYIRGYRALVDWSRVDHAPNHVQAIIEVKVSPKKSRGFDDIAETITSFDEVSTLMLVSGSFDLMLVINGKSFQDIAQFVARRLAPLDDVLSTSTLFVLQTYKKDGAAYLVDEPDERECTGI